MGRRAAAAHDFTLQNAGIFAMFEAMHCDNVAEHTVPTAHNLS